MGHVCFGSNISQVFIMQCLMPIHANYTTTTTTNNNDRKKNKKNGNVSNGISGING